MRRHLSPGYVSAAVCLACLTGCAATSKKPTYPDDPLLVSKKPVDGKQEPPSSLLLARAEPVAPTPPAALLAARPPREPILAPVVTAPTSRAEPPHIRATPASRRRVHDTYGHAADFAWLQGVLTRSAAGTLELRYLAPTAAGVDGGVVTLEDDPRLSGFRSGDVILVEGEGLGPHPPRRYRVHSVWLVKRG